MFKKLEGDTVMLLAGGVYSSADLYEWDGGLYAKLGSGFVRLRSNGTTTKQGVAFVHMECEKPLFMDSFQRLAVAPAAGGRVQLQYADGTLQITKV